MLSWMSVRCDGGDINHPGAYICRSVGALQQQLRRFGYPGRQGLKGAEPRERDTAACAVCGPLNLLSPPIHTSAIHDVEDLLVTDNTQCRLTM